MKKTVTINWVTYTQKKMDPFYNGKSDIYDLYKTPSYEKVCIFRKWQDKLNCIYWLSGNTNFFSISWDVIDENGKLHNVKITRSNNYILD